MSDVRHSSERMGTTALRRGPGAHLPSKIAEADEGANYAPQMPLSAEIEH